jgi:hypothetical protein
MVHDHAIPCAKHKGSSGEGYLAVLNNAVGLLVVAPRQIRQGETLPQGQGAHNPGLRPLLITVR